MNQIKQIITQTGIELVLTVLLTFVISAPAFAGDNKVYPGSACLPVNQIYAPNLVRVGGKTQANGASIVVRCPIVRDITGGGIPNSFVDVKGDIDINSCTLNTYRENGTLIAKHGDDDRRFTDMDNDIKRFDMRNATQSNQGAYEIECTLRKGAEIVRYSMAEGP